MKVIYKYPIHLTGMEYINSYEGAEVLSVGYDPSGVPCVWAMVDTAKPQYPLNVLCLGTGWEVDMSFDYKFIGTINDGPYMWHIFQVKGD